MITNVVMLKVDLKSGVVRLEVSRGYIRVDDKFIYCKDHKGYEGDVMVSNKLGEAYVLGLMNRYCHSNGDYKDEVIKSDLERCINAAIIHKRDLVAELFDVAREAEEEFETFSNNKESLQKDFLKELGV